MSYLHLLSESDNDDIFYEAIAEKITGKQFEVLPLRARRGAGSGTIMQLARRLLISLHQSGPVDETYFLLSIDNDRAPQYPDEAQPQVPLPASDRKKGNRHRQLIELAHEILGESRDHWPIKGAIAVPVEMLESWILLGCGCCTPEELPIFSKADKAGAREASASLPPPPQLKELIAAKRKEMGFESVMEFLLHCATDKIDISNLAEKSRSFRYFHEDLVAWK